MRAEQLKRYDAILSGLDYNLNVTPLGANPNAKLRTYHPLRVIPYYEPLPHEYFICETGRQIFSCATLETARLYWKNEIEPKIKNYYFDKSDESPVFICWHNGRQVKM